MVLKNFPECAAVHSFGHLGRAHQSDAWQLRPNRRFNREATRRL